MKRKDLIFIFLFFGIDQISKFLLETFLSDPLIVIPNFFSLVLLHNNGASLGLFKGQRIFLILVTILVFYFLLKEKKKARLNEIQTFCFAMLCGGILGNLMDRIFYGYVRDFLSFTFGSYSFPVFNLADVFIVLGSFFFFLGMMKKS